MASFGEIEDRVNALAVQLEGLKVEVRALTSSCRLKHTTLDVAVDEVRKEVDRHDEALDAIKGELTEQGRTLKQVVLWVERWGMETTHLGAHLEKLDERQGQVAKTVAAILEKMGEVMNVVNEVAANTRRAS